MGASYQNLLDDFLEQWNADCGNDPELAQIQLEALGFTVQAILEKLRDRFDAGLTPSDSGAA